MTVVPLGDPVIENAQIVGNWSGGFFAIGERGLKLFFLGGVLHLDVVANGPDRIVRPASDRIPLA